MSTITFRLIFKQNGISRGLNQSNVFQSSEPNMEAVMENCRREDPTASMVKKLADPCLTLLNNFARIKRGFPIKKDNYKITLRK